VIPYPDFSDVKVIVLGDIILDRYFWGDVHRISPEGPVPVVKIAKKTMSPGGAGNVAMNLKGLGCHQVLLGLAGDDANGKCLGQILAQEGIQHDLVTIPQHLTTTKTRIVGQGQQVVRLDEEKRPVVNSDTREALFSLFDKALAGATGVILSDYGKGIMTTEIAGHVIEKCRAKKIPLFIDPKGTDWERYQGAFCITPNQAEFRLIEPFVGEEEDLLDEKAIKVLARYDLEYLLLTRGAKGMTLYRRQQPPVHIQAQAREVFDVSGAGDTVIAAMAAAASTGVPMIQAAEIANTAAGIVVGKLGTQPVQRLELKQALSGNRLDSTTKVVTRQRAEEKIEAWRRAGNKITFTNGCFDILHVGHIKLLHAAAALGNRLIVGLNSDRSIRNLKGENRPIVPEDERAALLSSIDGVDLVVIFDQETPIDLIESFLPDVIVKGGDYRPETVVGADIVEKNGGTVVIVPLIGGISSTHIIESISRNSLANES
jgi:D-beta-D-heptose 7-phosphate kinase/D-beta-D-heptose 1-phosphate adenosyltransferase